MLCWGENKLDGLSRREKTYFSQLLTTHLMVTNVIHLIYHHLHVIVLTAGTCINAHVSEPSIVTVMLGKEYKW